MHKAFLSLTFLIAMFSSDLSRSSSCDSTFVMGLRATIPRLSIVGGFADVNHNGRLNIIANSDTIAGPFHVTYLSAWESDSGFTWREIYKGSTRYFPHQLGDIDSDGLFDVFLRNPSQQPNRIDLWESIDSTRLPLPPIDPWQQDSLGRIIWSYTVGAIGSSFDLPFLEDVDGDGRAEIIFLNGDSLGPIFDIWRVSGNNTFRRLPRVGRLTTVGTSMVAGDFDNDGFQEFTSGSTNDLLYVYEYQPPDSFVLRQVLQPGAAYYGTRLCDVNRNGRDEFVYGAGLPSRGFQLYTMFEAIGNDQYAVIWRDTVYEFPLGYPVFRTGDIDGDGVEELVVYTEVGLRIYKWYEPMGFRCVWRAQAGDQFFRVFDSDNNGKTEIWTGGGTVRPTYVYEFEGLTSVPEADSRISWSFSLSQNYPNPFNAETRIAFTLQAQAHVLLHVYDLLGREVKALVEERLPPGDHVATWDGTDGLGRHVSSGIYFYRLTSGGIEQTKPMHLLR